LTNLTAGDYELYVYAYDGKYQLQVGGVEYGVKSCHDTSPAGVPVWQEGRQYVHYSGVKIAAGENLTLTVQPGLYGYAIISGLQLVYVAAPPPPASFLVDVDFGAGNSTAKTGAAAVGQTNDFWNFYTRDDGAGGWRTFGVLAGLKQVDGTSTAVGLTVENAPGAWGNGSTDPMYNSYIYPFEGEARLTVTNLPAGRYDFYVYANDGNYQLAAGNTDYGIATCLDTALSSPPVWQAGVQYVRFPNVTVTNASVPVVLTVRSGSHGYALLSGLQITGTTTTGTADEHCGRVAVHCSPGQCVRLRFTGIPSHRYRVQASEDLKHWLDLGCAVSDNGGNCEFEDRDSGNFSHRYYRIVQP